ncbi:MAG: pirin family protein [Candidatus Lokiarchaeota archaeon]|nr:pirin family protein [Candidatus Lokiarchaeota archaeon]
MSKIREVRVTLKSRSTMEGAGVRLKRAFGYADPSLDPFLLLDDFHSDNPDDYMAGFPWHPHRGIETITYMLHGRLEHGDSMKNSGIIGAGDVQWMTAGSGIIHQEMPKKDENDSLLVGFQLWANLPASHKMMNPRYRDITKDQIPEVVLNDNVKVKIICGEINGVKGPVQDVITDPEYLDVSIEPNSEFRHSIANDHNIFAYVIEGEATLDPIKDEIVGAEHLVIFREGDEVLIQTKDKSVRFLLISGKPIGEPVAWRGPIVMNTEEELRLAFNEYNKGTFIKHK